MQEIWIQSSISSIHVLAIHDGNTQQLVLTLHSQTTSSFPRRSCDGHVIALDTEVSIHTLIDTQTHTHTYICVYDIQYMIVARGGGGL